ncbi:hypothetical protein CPC08DRAFT_731345 [Agrocybe pediades]|nr:hypothetical protein CPC08DRAFT_731345 [Agrocybe pediades]
MPKYTTDSESECATPTAPENKRGSNKAAHQHHKNSNPCSGHTGQPPPNAHKSRRKSAVVGELKTQSHFFSGGLLDSQTDSQAWYNAGCQITTSISNNNEDMQDIKAEEPTADSSNPEMERETFKDALKTASDIYSCQLSRMYALQELVASERKQSRKLRTILDLQEEVQRLRHSEQESNNQLSQLYETEEELACARGSLAELEAERLELEANEAGLKEEIDSLREQLSQAKALFSDIRDKLAVV